MKKSIAFIFIFTIICHAAWRDGHINSDRIGGFLLQINSTKNPQSCYDLCHANNICSAWSWNHNNYSCRLLTGKTQAISLFGVTSGTDANSLAPKMYTPLKTGSVTPTGWLGQQMKIQADGLTGHLSLFWPDVMSSVWIGGTADGADDNLHERTPYWLNGMVPLAYLLQNMQSPITSSSSANRLRADPICKNGTDMPGYDIMDTTVKTDQDCYNLCMSNWDCVAFIINDCDSNNIHCWLKNAIGSTTQTSCRCFGTVEHDIPSIMDQTWNYLNYIIAHQAPSGWLGPDDQTDGDQFWAPMNVLQSLTMAAEANSTMFNTITNVLLKYFQEADRRMRNVCPLQYWAAERYQDMVLSIHWLLENAPQNQEQFLWDLAELCKTQGVDWEQWFANWTGNAGTHGVNNAQGLKSSAVMWRQTQDPSLVNSSQQRLINMDSMYGLPSGMFCADELLCNQEEKQMPSRGTELCAVVEAMFSYEIMFSIHGFIQFADRVERITFNAMPATWASPKGGDMWNHQYLQAVNQIMATYSDPHVWTNDGPEAEIYGLEPNYGCCTANHPQGWPKFANNLFFISQDNGVVVGIYAPASAVLPNKMGSISVVTDYPYDDMINIILTANMNLPLYIRIPIWATKAQVTINGGNTVSVSNGTMYKISALTGTTKVLLKLNPEIRMEQGWNGAYSVHRGPLMFSLNIQGFYSMLRSYSFESKDYSVIPVTQWAFALQADPFNPNVSLKYYQTGYIPNSAPFNASGPWPVYIEATVRSLPSWGIEKGSAAPPPASPACTSSPDTCGPPITVRLVPYGATSLRITEMPLAGTNLASLGIGLNRKIISDPTSCKLEK